MLQLRVGRYRSAIDLRDHIERPQLAFVSRRIGFDRAHDHAFVDAFEQIADRRIVAQRFDADAEPGPDDLVPGNQLLADFVHQIARDGETEAAIEAVDERVHPDHFAVDVAERTAAVAGIDRGVGLQVIRDVVAAGRRAACFGLFR